MEDIRLLRAWEDFLEWVRLDQSLKRGRDVALIART